MKKRSIKDYLIIAAKGVSMGAADVVPGVSGGTMAFILGIYEELINSIRQIASLETLKLIFTFKFRKAYDELPWRFLLALGSGIILAILSLAKFLKWALSAHPSMIWGFFFGLVVASIIVVLNKVKKWGASTITSTIIGAVGAFFIVGMLSRETPDAYWFIFISGSVAITAMILPGISGSFILLLMGKYHYILTALTTLMAFGKGLIKGEPVSFDAEIQQAILSLSFFIAGIIAGLASFVQLLNWLFKKYHDITVALLIGFMAGSLRKIWPWKEGVESSHHTAAQVNTLPECFGKSEIVVILLAIVGFVTVILLNKLASQKETKENQ